MKDLSPETITLIFTSLGSLICAFIAAYHSWKMKPLIRKENEELLKRNRNLQDQINGLQTFQESKLGVFDALYKHITKENISNIIEISTLDLKLSIEKKNEEIKAQNSKLREYFEEIEYLEEKIELMKEHNGQVEFEKLRKEPGDYILEDEIGELNLENLFKAKSLIEKHLASFFLNDGEVNELPF